MENKTDELHELSESIYMSGYALDWKDSDDIAEQLYNEGYRKQEWISVEERLPETSGYYYAHLRIGLCDVFHYSAKHKAFNAHDSLDNCDYAISVTHWMPLPEPPKGVAE
jgi:hypothetical protein